MTEETERFDQMKQLLETTTLTSLPFWMQRLRENFNDVINGKDFQQIPREPQGSVVIVSGGPSIEKYRLLERLRKSGYEGCIITTDRRLTDCLKSGVIPRFVCSCDASDDVEKFFNWKMLKHKHNFKKIKAVFGVVSPPKVVKNWKGEKYWCLPVLDSAKDPLSITMALHHLTRVTVTDTLGNVTGLATLVALYLGKNPIAYIGLDLSFPGIDKPEETSYWKDWEHDARKDTAFRKIHNPITNEDYLTELRLEMYRNLLINVLAGLEPRLEIWNLSQQGIFFGEHIKWATIEEFTEKYVR